MEDQDLIALFGILKNQGVFNTQEEMQSVIDSEGVEVLYSALPKGIFNSPEEFAETFSQVKKKDESEFIVQEDVTESITPTEMEEPVSLESSTQEDVDIVKDSVIPNIPTTNYDPMKDTFMGKESPNFPELKDLKKQEIKSNALDEYFSNISNEDLKSVMSSPKAKKQYEDWSQNNTKEIPTELDQQIYQATYGKAIEQGDTSVPSIEEWLTNEGISGATAGDANKEALEMAITAAKTLEKSYDETFIGDLVRTLSIGNNKELKLVQLGKQKEKVYSDANLTEEQRAEKIKKLNTTELNLKEGKRDNVWASEPMMDITGYAEGETSEFATGILSTVVDFFATPNVGIAGAITKVLPKLPILGVAKYATDALVKRGFKPSVASKIIKEQLPKVVETLDKAGSKFALFETAKDFQQQVDQYGGISEVDFTQSPEAFAKGYGLGAGLGLIGVLGRQIPKLGAALKTEGATAVKQKGVTQALVDRGLSDSRIIGTVGETIGLGGEVATFGLINATTPTLENPEGELTTESFTDGMSEALKYIIGFRAVGLASRVAKGQTVFNKQYSEFNKAEKEQAFSLMTEINNKIKSGELTEQSAIEYLKNKIDVKITPEQIKEKIKSGEITEANAAEYLLKQEVKSRIPITLIDKVLQEISGMKSNLSRKDVFNKVFEIEAQAKTDGTYRINTYSKDGLLLTTANVSGPAEVSGFINKFKKVRANEINKANNGQGNYPINNKVNYSINPQPLLEAPISEGDNVTNITNIVTEEYAAEKLIEEGVQNATPEEVKEKQLELLKEQENAIQEPSTETVDVQEQTGDSQTVGEGDTEVIELTTETTQEIQEPDVSPEVQAEIAAMEADERIDLSVLDAIAPTQEAISNKEAKKSTPEFRKKPLSTLTESQNTEQDIKEASILEVLNQRADNTINVSEITETETTPSQINVQALNERTGGNFKEFDIKTLNDVPVMWNISDQLITGNYNPNITDVNQNYSVINPLTGTEITNLKGGLGFSSVKGHEDIAWASVTTDKVDAQQKAAKEVYDKNPAKFDKLWADGVLPDGHIPMVIVKMGNDSMKSNEAMIRVISDNLKSFPKKNKKAALKALKEQLKVVKESYQEVVDTGLTKNGEKAKPLTIKNYFKFIGEVEDVQNMIKAIKPKSIEDVLSTENLNSLKGISSVVQITNLMTSGNFNVLKKEPSKSKKPVIKALYGESPSQQDINKFNTKKIADVITEPELANVPQRSAFMVTAIDIKNPETVRTSHPNYPVGPKGKVLGILKQPISIVDLVPAAYNNVALGIAEEVSGKRKARSDKARLVQTIPVQAGLANRELLGTPIGINTDKRFLDFLQRSFPDTNMIVDTDTFNGVMQRDGVKKYLKGGDVIYGVTLDGKIFINPDVHETSSALFNTAIHEMGHVWTKYIQQTPKGKKLYNKGIELVKETDTYREQLEIFNGDVIKAAEEAMAILIGNKGETITNESIKSKWLDWLIGLWDYVKSQFKQFKDLTNKQIQDLNLDQFLGTALRDILSGKPIKMTPKQRAAMKADVAFRKMDPSRKIAVEGVVKKLRDSGYSEVGIAELLDKKGFDANLIAESMAKVKKAPVKPKLSPELKKEEKKKYNPQTFIKEARNANFTDERIMDYLVKRKDMKVKDVRELLDVNIDLLDKLPKSFGNITGGAIVGLKLFNKVQAFRDKLIAKNNKLKKNKLSEGKIMDETIQFLESQPEYKAEADTYKVKGEIKVRKDLSTIQAQMITEFQKMNVLRPTQAMRAKLETARRDINQRAKGVRDLKATQAILKSFIRKTIPASQYSKADVVKLINAVSRADKASIDNLINEVFEFAVSKNVKTLQGNIKDILNIKTEEIYGGRLKGVKVDSETAKLIKLINESVLTDKSTADEIEASNEVERQKINKLSESPIENMSEIMARTSLIGINNSLLMENNDPSKVDALDTSLENLDALVSKGKSELAILLEAQKAEYNKQFEEAYLDITGEKIDMSNPDSVKLLKQAKSDVASKENKKNVQNRLTSFANNILEGTRDFIYTAEALQGLMDAISKMPGELFGGKMQELVTDKIDASSRKFKERRLMYNEVLTNKFKDIYGKKWKSMVRSNAIPTTIIDSIDMIYSQNQLYYLYNQFKDPANHPAFKKMWGSEEISKNDSSEEKKRKNSINITEAKKVAAEIESKLDPKVKQFADWQVDEYFPSLFEYYNEPYKKIYRTDMPLNEFYAGRIYRDGITPEALDLLGTNSIIQTSVGGSSTKSRLDNTKEIMAMDGTDALMTYLNDMEFFAAYAENVRDINKIFTNPYIKATIEANHGKALYNLIQDRIQQVANQGTKNPELAKFINRMNNVFITTRVALSPVIFLKQMTSTITYTSEIGIKEYIKYAVKNKSQMVKVFKEIRDNSVYMKDRGATNIIKVIESYTDSAMKKFVPNETKDFFINAMMWFVRTGDKGAIYLGGMPLYSYYKAKFKEKKPKATEQEAIDYAILKFEKATKTTQQSSDIQDKDYFQTGGFLTRGLNAFKTTPKQYLRREIMSIRNLYRKAKANDKNAGKGTLYENLREFAMFHMVMPAFFQWVSAGLPGVLTDWDDEDDQDMIRAMLIGNLNALFILGEVIGGLGDLATGKPWASDIGKQVGILELSGSIIKKIQRANQLKDPEKKAEAQKQLYAELLTLIRVPAPQLLRMTQNAEKISSEGMDSGELILRLLNYSNYVIEGGGKKKKSKNKPSMTKTDLKKFDPELYDIMYNSEANAEIKAIQKELKDLEDIGY